MKKMNIAKMVAEEVTKLSGKKTVAREVQKNNGVQYTAIGFEEENVSPIIYIDSYIEDGLSTEEIAAAVIKTAKKNEASDEILTVAKKLRDWDFAKERIRKILVNSDQDFQDIVHDEIPKTDLSFIYSIVTDEDEYSRSSVKVTKSLLSYWGVSIKELKEAATTGEPTVTPMSEVLSELGAGGVEELEEYLSEDEGMLVVTNKSRCFGAGCILKALDEIQEIVKGREFYILPSSVHECLVIWGSKMDTNQLKEMVEMVNKTEVLPEEILSNHVYRLTEDGLSIAA